MISARYAFGFVITPDSGTTIGSDVPPAGTPLACIGPLAKLLCVIKKVSDVIITVKRISDVIEFIPHSFPFGGPILSSEQACTVKFDDWFAIPCLLGPFCTGPTILVGPARIPIPLGGRAIEVGPPVPSGGKIIAFPWISNIFKEHTENRAGPWSLGLGFSPFPLQDINDGLNGIVITIPPNLLDLPCIAYNLSPDKPLNCIENIHFDCTASGEKDPAGHDIYKVIRLLGTSKEDASQQSLNDLRTQFPSFPWP